MEKKELALDMKYFNAYQAFWRDFQSEQDKPYVLLGINLIFTIEKTIEKFAVIADG